MLDEKPDTKYIMDDPTYKILSRQKWSVILESDQ